jgi:hypothetical protein
LRDVHRRRIPAVRRDGHYPFVGKPEAGRDGSHKPRAQRGDRLPGEPLLLGDRFAEGQQLDDGINDVPTGRVAGCRPAARLPLEQFLDWPPDHDG